MLGFGALGQFALGQSRLASATLIGANVGSYTLTGQAALFSISVPLKAAAFTLAGQDAVFPARMAAETGTYTLSGQAVTLATGASIVASPLARSRARFVGFSALGSAALGQGSSLQIGTTYTLRGSDISFSYAVRADTGAYTLTGSAARLVEGYIQTAEAGAYSVTGQAAHMTVSVPLGSGTYTLSGNVLEMKRYIAKIRAFPRVGAPAFSARSKGRDTVKVRAFGG